VNELVAELEWDQGERACQVTSVRMLGDELHIGVIVGDPYGGYTPDAPASLGPTFNIVCHDYTEAVVVLGGWADLEVSSGHALLLAHSAPSAQVGFRGEVDDPHRVMGALFAAHKDVMADWVPFSRFLNEMSLARLLRGGYGTLASGPLPLMEAYASALTDCGVAPSVHTIREPAPRRPSGDLVAASDLVVVILDAGHPEGTTYVVCRSPAAGRVEPPVTVD
jgi:hypothetical protein